jgi:hypothetical protein
MINTSDKYFLQIEPNKDGPATAPINDELTEKVIFIYNCTVMPHGGMRYKGFHTVKRYDGFHDIQLSKDGLESIWISSDNADHYLPNGAITNSLCVHYVQYFRPYIPQIEIDKIHKYYDICKANPNKRWKKDWENSVYKELKPRIHREQSEAEREAERKRWAEESAQMDREREARADKAEAEDKRNPYFKDVLKRAGVYKPEYDPEANYWNNLSKESK